MYVTVAHQMRGTYGQVCVDFYTLDLNHHLSALNSNWNSEAVKTQQLMLSLQDKQLNSEHHGLTPDRLPPPHLRTHSHGKCERSRLCGDLFWVETGLFGHLRISLTKTWTRTCSGLTLLSPTPPITHTAHARTAILYLFEAARHRERRVPMPRAAPWDGSCGHNIYPGKTTVVRPHCGPSSHTAGTQTWN